MSRDNGAHGRWRTDRRLEEQKERNAREGLGPFRFDADEKIQDIDRHQDGERKQKTEQEFLGRAVYSGGSPSTDVPDHKARLMSVASQNR